MATWGGLMSVRKLAGLALASLIQLNGEQITIR
jgi:hypothetical protein